MKLLISLLMLLPLAAQTPATAPAQPPAPAPAAEAKPADAAPPAEATKTDASAAPAASPVPTGENWLTGFIDVGYRWRTGVDGSMDTYRTIVNLNPGLMLLGAEFTIRDPKRRLFDRIEVRGYDWGNNDPYSTVHVNVFKENAYQLITDYRSYALFDNVPSFADPYITNGTMLDEQSFDMRRRIGNVLLEIKPGTWLVPYLAWDHDSGDGDGVTTFVSGLNQFPFLSQMNDSTESYRGGVRLELRRFHVTLEEGGTTFKSAQNTFVPPGNAYYGSAAPINGTTLDLTSLAQAYGIRGSSIYSKALVTAHVTDWMDVTGQFLYSIPSTTTNYQQYNYGNFASVNQALFYNSEQNLVDAAAKMPHSTGSAGTEIRPFKRIRVVDSWMTDRLHNAAGALQNDILGKTPAINTDLTSLLITNYSQVEGMVFVDVLKGLVLRGGYRYVWGDADELVLPPEGLTTHDNLKLRRNVLLTGLSYRPNSKLSLSADAEVGSSGNAYFPVSLYDYQKVRVHGNYQLPWSLNLSANVTVLQNTSPLPNKNDFLSHTESMTLQWNPKVTKRFSFIGTWEHESLASDIYYLPPQTLVSTLSNYWESGHTITGMVATSFPLFGKDVQFSGGGSFLLSDGTRATNYYQPVGKLSVPLSKHLAWNSEWSYYGFGEAYYLYESFHTHLITTGLRFTR